MISLDSLLMRARNLFGSSLHDNICFIHIPKCAGTSISNAIKKLYLTLDLRKDRYVFNLDSVASANVIRCIDGTEYPYDTNDDSPILKLREQLLLYFMNQKNIRYLSGHFAFSDLAYDKFHDKYAFITILRDPVKRFGSSYLYNVYKDKRFSIDHDFAKYMESEFGQSQGHEFVKFLGGPNRSGDYTSKSAIERAKANLHKFTIVGALEHMNHFRHQFEHHFGVKLKIGHRNRSPKSGAYKKSIMNEEIEAKMRKICKPDCELYEYALENFVKIQG